MSALESTHTTFLGWGLFGGTDVEAASYKFVGHISGGPIFPAENGRRPETIRKEAGGKSTRFSYSKLMLGSWESRQ